MPLKTIGQLDTLAQHSKELSNAALFIVEQDNIVGKTTLYDIASLIMETIEGYVDDQFSTTYLTVQQTITSLTSQLQSKAEIGHTHLPASVGLGNVQNISPEDMPVSTALQLALNDKQDIGIVEATAIVINTPEW